MEFCDFALQLTGDRHLPPALWQEIGRSLSAGKSISDLLENPALNLPPATLRSVSAAFRDWLRWQHLTEDLVPLVPDSLLHKALEPHQLRCIRRLVQQISANRWNAGLDLWTRCMALAIKKGRMRVDGRLGLGFDEYLQKTDALNGYSPHRWFRIRRGEYEGALKLELFFEAHEFHTQAELLGLSPADLQCIVLDHLPEEIRSYFDSIAEHEAIQSARTQYAALLQTSPTTEFPVLAVAVGQSLGSIVFDSPLHIAQTSVCRREIELEMLAARHNVRTVVLPTRASEGTSLSILRRTLAPGRTLVQVSPSGLSEARESHPEARTLPRPVGSAFILARRAIDPLSEWARIDPCELGLAEYQNDLDLERLRLELQEEMHLARHHLVLMVQRPTLQMSPELSAKSLEELRVGKMVSGVVTSLTPFGAFVDVGLEQEGLIHVSEIADRFVKDPAEVVKVGQNVLARVLSVDIAQHRIALSLRREARPESRSKQTEARSKAMVALDQLFKVKP